VRKTFNDHDFLFPGTIISNEALFCFDESSEIVKEKSVKVKDFYIPCGKDECICLGK